MIIPILVTLIIGSFTGYEAGKAGQKVEAYEQGKVCFDQEYEGRKAGCYKVERYPAAETPNR